MRLLFLLLLVITVDAYALHMSKSDFCLSQEVAEEVKVKNRFTVEGKAPHPVLISTVSRLMEEFNIPGPLIFHFTDYVGPRKVWSLKLSSGHHVYFSRNAIDLLLGIELQKVAEEVCRPEFTGSKSFTVSYTNTVMEQFLRNAASDDSLRKTLEKKTGWKLRREPGEEYYNEEQEFRTEELVTLIKQLMDIPTEVFKKMKLKNVTRWRIGAPLPIKTANAIYYVKDQVIQFGDGAFMDNKQDVYGEGTVLHEMGHAYWYGIPEARREKFINMSWVKKDKEWVKKAPGSDGFITEYSMTNPEEDFAEHFSAFMHNPEFLKRRAMAKNNYFEDNVFTDATFFSTVAENAKVRITSPTPDTKDPWLENDVIFRHLTEAKVREDGSKITDINVVVDKAYDDISGIASTLQSYEHTKNNEYRIIVKLEPERRPDGTWTLKGNYVTNPKELAPGMYRPSTFALKDNAGNTQYYESERLPDVFIDGLLSVEKVPAPEIDLSKINISHAPVINGYPGVIVTLPIPWKEDLDSIHYHWEYEAVQQKTVHVCNPSGKVYRDDAPCFLTGKPGENIKLQGYFFKEYPSSTVKLASFSLHYKGTETKSKASHDYIVPQNLSNASIYIETPTQVMRIHDLDVNQMKLKAVTKSNREGGDQNIEVTVPLTNRDAGKFYIYNTVRSPTGKNVLSIATENDSKAGHRIEVVGGVHYLTYTIPLKKNPEDGVYIIESFELKTEFERPFNPGLPLDHNDVAVRKIKLLERGIKRTFTITDDKVTNLN